MQSSVSLNLPQTMTVSSTPVAINSPHSWRRRINTMVTDAASPVEPGKQCKKRTNVHYQSEIPHKIPIQDQRGSFKGWHSSLGSEHTGRFHSQVFSLFFFFLVHFHQMKTITRRSNKSFVRIICLNQSVSVPSALEKGEMRWKQKKKHSV